MEDTMTVAQGLTLSFTDGPELARSLNNACLFTSKDSSRPVLTMVRFTVTGPTILLEATDGYAMIRETVTTANVEQTESATFLVSRDVLADVAKMAKSIKYQGIDLTFSPVAPEGQKVTFTLAGRTITDGWTDQTYAYPNAESLWHQWTSMEVNEVGFQSVDLARLGKVSASVGKPSRGDVAHFCFNEAGKPAIVRFGQSIDILQMPGKWIPRF